MAAPEVVATLKLRDDMSPALRTAQSHVASFASFAQTAGATMVGFLGAQVVNNIGNFISASITARAESDKLVAQTAAVIKSTGGAARVTADHVDALANAIKRYSGVDDEAITNGENLLLTFTGIRNQAGKGNDIFDRTTKIMVDMARALGTDASGSAIQLGKALNDPIRGITALTRVGVTFSDEQRKQIKNFMAHHDVLSAQKVILRELTKEFGGSAEAFGRSSAGMMEKSKNAVGDMQEAVGGVFLTLMGKIAPYITDIANASGDWLTKNQPLIDQIAGWTAGGLKTMWDLFQKLKDPLAKAFDVLSTLAPYVAAVAAAWALWNAALLVTEGVQAVIIGAQFVAGLVAIISKVGLLTAAQWLLNLAMDANPVGLITLAIAALVAGVIWAYQNVGWFRYAVNALGGGLLVFGKQLWTDVKPAVDAIAKAFGWVFDAVGAFATQFWTDVKPVFDWLIPILKEAWSWLGKLAQALGLAAPDAQAGGGNFSSAAHARTFPKTKPKHRAGGGDVFPGSGYYVGEGGTEFFSPRVPGIIVPNGGGGGGATSILPLVFSPLPLSRDQMLLVREHIRRVEREQQ